MSRKFGPSVTRGVRVGSSLLLVTVTHDEGANHLMLQAFDAAPGATYGTVVHSGCWAACGFSATLRDMTVAETEKFHDAVFSYLQLTEDQGGLDKRLVLDLASYMSHLDMITPRSVTEERQAPRPVAITGVVDNERPLPHAQDGCALSVQACDLQD
eukprot:26626-Eustigmatos_ZCMA.PRE.1